MTDHGALIDFYLDYGESSFAADEPAYAEVCRRLRDYPDLVALIARHDPDAQQPNLLFAAVHYLLLGGLDHPLRQIYDGTSDDAVAPVFADLVLTHADEVNALLATRRTQTNEVGRGADLALMLADAHDQTDRSLAWIDLGTSGGLNLNLDRFRIDYTIDGATRATGDSESPVQLRCHVRTGNPPVRSEHAPVSWRVGVDRSPIDVANRSEARWLQACLWPSKRERHERLAAAIAIAADSPPRIIEADAAEGVRQALDDAPQDATLVLTTTWVWYYLPTTTQREVIDVLHTSGRPIWWYSLEGRGVIAELGQPPEREVIDSIVGRVKLDGGRVQSADVLALSHPHGAWLDWY